MRPLEIALLAGLVLGLLLQFTPVNQRPKFAYWLPFGSLALLLMHLLLEGVRWQMAPAYALTLLNLPFAVSNLRYTFQAWLAWQAEDNPLGRTAGAIISALVLLDALFLLWLAPLFRMPEPGGPYAIGTRFIYFEDSGREEAFTQQTGDVRAISAQVWYPGERGPVCFRQPYLAPARQVSRTYASFLGLPWFSFTHLELLRTHACRDARPADGQFPVLIFSHAYDGNITQDTILMEQLASQGYIVFSLGHPYETPFIFDASGSAILYDADNPARTARLDEIDDMEAGRIKVQILASNNPDGQGALFRRLLSRTPLLMESVRTWAADTASLLDWLEAVDRSDPLAASLDLSRVGVFGHSLGGAAAGQFCLQDARCDAGLNMDGFQYGDLIESDLQAPFMFMYSALPDNDSSRVNEYFYERVQNDAYSLVIEGTTHQSFCDLPFYFQDYLIENRLVQIEPERAMQIITAYTLSFFDRYLKGIDSDLLHGSSSQFPEVKLDSHGS